MGCLLEFVGVWFDFNAKTFSIKNNESPIEIPKKSL
jgi:hypothetical protein